MFFDNFTKEDNFDDFSSVNLSKLKFNPEESGWSGGAMVLGKLPVPGRPTLWMIVGQGPIALAVGAGGAVWTLFFSPILSLLFLPLSGRRPDMD